MNVRVLVGASNPHRNGLERLAAKLPHSVEFQTDTLRIAHENRDHRRKAGLLAALHREQGLAQPRKSLSDNEVHAFIDLHRELLVEGFADAIGRRRTAGLVHPGQAEIAGD